jgi:hypothetical protein
LKLHGPGGEFFYAAWLYSEAASADIRIGLKAADGREESRTPGTE